MIPSVVGDSREIQGSQWGNSRSDKCTFDAELLTGFLRGAISRLVGISFGDV